MTEQSTAEKLQLQKPGQIDRAVAWTRRNTAAVVAWWPFVAVWHAVYLAWSIAAGRVTSATFNGWWTLLRIPQAYLSGWYLTAGLARSLIVWVAVPTVLTVVSAAHPIARNRILIGTDAWLVRGFRRKWPRRAKLIAAKRAVDVLLIPKLLKIEFGSHVTPKAIWAGLRRPDKQPWKWAFLPDELVLTVRLAVGQSNTDWAVHVADGAQDLFGYLDNEIEYNELLNAYRISLVRQTLPLMEEVGTPEQCAAHHKARSAGALAAGDPPPPSPTPVDVSVIGSLGPNHVAMFRDVTGDYHGPALSASPHGVIVGRTGTGKSSAERAIAAHAARFGCPMLILDFKSGGGGIDVQPLIGRVPVLGIEDVPRIIAILRYLIDEMIPARRDLLFQHSARDLKDLPPEVRNSPAAARWFILVGESPKIFTGVGDPFVDTHLEQLSLILLELAREARQFGFHVFHTGQQPAGKHLFGKHGQAILDNHASRAAIGKPNPTTLTWFLNNETPDSVARRGTDQIKGRGIFHNMDPGTVVPKLGQIIHFEDDVFAQLLEGYDPAFPSQVELLANRDTPIVTGRRPAPITEAETVVDITPDPAGLDDAPTSLVDRVKQQRAGGAHQ